MLTRGFLIILLLTPSLSWAAAETLYVRPSAACASNGDGTAYDCAASPGAPGAYRTFANVLTSATDETAGTVDPGDTLYICGAHTDQLTYGATGASAVGSGVFGNLITISWNCPSDPGSIDGTGNNYGFYSEQDYLTIIAPVVSGGTLGSFVLYDNGGAETATRAITVTGGTVGPNPNVGRMCLEARGRYITISGVTIEDCATDGIWMKGKYNLVTGNTIRRVSTGDANGDCVQFSGEVDGTVIHDNACDHSNIDSKYCFISSGDTDAGTVTITNNTCLHYTGATVGSGIYLENPGIIRSNTVTGGKYGIQCAVGTGERCDISGNLVTGATTAAIIVGATSTVATIVHNTTVDSPECLHFDVNSATASAKNNICTNATTGINKAVAGGAVIDQYNLFYNISGNNLVVNGTPTAPGTGSLLATDPQFIGASDYRARGTSPTRRAGTMPTPCADVRGRACYPDRPDLGAYQATSGDPAATRAVRS